METRTAPSHTLQALTSFAALVTQTTQAMSFVVLELHKLVPFASQEGLKAAFLMNPRVPTFWSHKDKNGTACMLLKNRKDIVNIQSALNKCVADSCLPHLGEWMNLRVFQTIQNVPIEESPGKKNITVADFLKDRDLTMDSAEKGADVRKNSEHFSDSDTDSEYGIRGSKLVFQTVTIFKDDAGGFRMKLRVGMGEDEASTRDLDGQTTMNTLHDTCASEALLDRSLSDSSLSHRRNICFLQSHRIGVSFSPDTTSLSDDVVTLGDLKLLRGGELKVCEIW